MTLAAGSRLGPYEILSPLGAGGMGEVYRARDAKLHREVAVKVLPEAVSKDPARLARLEREAQLLASLNHPHIGGIYGVEESRGVLALVLELVPGETLGERIDRGPMPLDEALPIAQQIGDALEAAHERGIVHRDLKPANVKITPDGSVKVLDFGIAKALAIDGSSTQQTSSPTLTAQATQEGVIFGTAAYLSPEQARGKAVDKRSDIWSFGAVLYEMLTGSPCFDGETVSDILAAVLRTDPDWSRLPPDTPPGVRRLLRRCLERDPKKRLRDIGDAWLDGAADASPAPSAPPPARRHVLVYAAAIPLALAAGFAAARFGRTAAPAVLPIATHSVIPLPPGARLSGWATPPIAISRDGRTLAFVAEKEGETQRLWVRRLDLDESRVVPDSDSAEGPFFSPDGQWIGFATDVSATGKASEGRLKKYSIATGLTQPIAPIPDFYGASWAQDGSILVAPSTTEGLWRLPAEGGQPDTSAERVVWEGHEAQRALVWPEILPEGGAAIVTDGDAIPVSAAALLDLRSRRLERIAPDVKFSRYAVDGRLLMLRPDRTLLAAPFDPRSRRITGPAVAVLKEVAFGGNEGGAFAVSENGTLVYATGYLRDSGLEPMRLARIDEKGEVELLPFEPDTFGRVAMPSPDGRSLVVMTADASVWIYDLARRVRSRVPAGNRRGQGWSVIWSPAGDRVTFSASARGRSGWAIVGSKADGSGQPEEVVPVGEEMYPLSWTPDGRSLIYTVFGKEPGLWMRTISNGGAPRQIVSGFVSYAGVSPDGRWIVYDFLAAEGWEVVAEGFPGPGPRVQIATAGGRTPRWSADGKSIFYRKGDRFFRVRIAAGDKLEATAPELLFQTPNLRGFAVAPDGKGFFGVVDPADSGIVRELHLVTNWFSELERLAPLQRSR